MSRLSPADTVEALLYGGEAVVDKGLELGVSENVRPVIFDAFSNQFADIERIDALGYAGDTTSGMGHFLTHAPH